MFLEQQDESKIIDIKLQKRYNVDIKYERSNKMLDSLLRIKFSEYAKLNPNELSEEQLKKIKELSKYTTRK